MTSSNSVLSPAFSSNAPVSANSNTEPAAAFRGCPRRCLLVKVPPESVPTDACVQKAFIPVNKISLSKHMLQPAAPRSLQHSHRVGGKRTGIHFAHGSADLSHSWMCMRVSLCAFVGFVSVGDPSAACGNKELVPGAEHLHRRTSAFTHVFMNTCFVNRHYGLALAKGHAISFHAVECVYLELQSIFKARSG